MGKNTCAFGLEKKPLSINIMAMKKDDLLTMQMYSNLQIFLKVVVKDFFEGSKDGRGKVDDQ